MIGIESRDLLVLEEGQLIEIIHVTEKNQVMECGYFISVFEKDGEEIIQISDQQKIIPGVETLPDKDMVKNIFLKKVILVKQCVVSSILTDAS